MNMNIGKMQKMLKQAQKAQSQMQAEIEALRVTGSAGGGVVTAMVDGQKNLLELKISAEALEEPDPEMLADLVLAAVSEAQRSADEQVQEKMDSITGMLGMPGGMPGF